MFLISANKRFHSFIYLIQSINYSVCIRGLVLKNYLKATMRNVTIKWRPVVWLSPLVKSTVTTVRKESMVLSQWVKDTVYHQESPLSSSFRISSPTFQMLGSLFPGGSLFTNLLTTVQYLLRYIKGSVMATAMLYTFTCHSINLIRPQWRMQ